MDDVEGVDVAVEVEESDDLRGQEGYAHDGDTAGWARDEEEGMSIGVVE